MQEARRSLVDFKVRPVSSRSPPLATQYGDDALEVLRRLCDRYNGVSWSPRTESMRVSSA